MAQTVKHLPTMMETQVDPWFQKILWRRKWQPTPVLWCRENPMMASVVGYSSWGCKESNTTERLHFTVYNQNSVPAGLFLFPIPDGDCSHEIKRRLHLGKKVMTNLDSILKSRDITLPKKVCLVKAMVFPVVMYGCQSWTIKKAEH